jgi:hypothetical protein
MHGGDRINIAVERLFALVCAGVMLNGFSDGMLCISRRMPS